MNRYIPFLTLMFFLSACATRTPSRLSDNSSSVIKIMPLGDSLTEGAASTGSGGYRTNLYAYLVKAGYKIDFVGERQNGPASLLDKDHQGVGGYRIDQVAKDIERALDRYQPDVVLLGAGGNDISQNHEVVTAPERLLQLAERIQHHRPQSTVIVQTRPIRSDAMNEKVKIFNQRVRALINEITKKNPKIFLQDNEPLLVVSDISPDHIHPNDQGYEKLAQGWFAALQKILPRPSSAQAP